MGHVDFVLPLDAGAVLVVGWEEIEDRQGLTARADGSGLEAAWRAPHRRRDLDPARALGWLSLYRPPGQGLELSLGGVSKTIGPADLMAYAGRFAAEVVDEALHACLWAMARGVIPCFGPGWQPRLTARLAAAQHPCVEGEVAALGIDGAMWSEGLGWGLAWGWSLSARGAGEVGALRLGAAGVRPLTIQPGPKIPLSVEDAVLRRYGGEDPQPWSMSLAAPSLGDDEILVLHHVPDGPGLIASQPLAAATTEAVAAGALELRQAGTLPLPTIDLSPVSPPAQPEDGQPAVHVELSHDAGPAALRDTIRCLSRGIKAPFSLAVTGPCDLAAALCSAAPDLAAAGVTLASRKGRAPEHAVILAAQSSAILQLTDWAAALTRLTQDGLSAVAVVHAPHVALLGPKSAAALDQALAVGGMGIVAVFTAAAWDIGPRDGPPAASAEGAVRQKLIALRNGGAALALIPDQTSTVVPPVRANAAWHFDRARLGAQA